MVLHLAGLLSGGLYLALYPFNRTENLHVDLPLLKANLQFVLPTAQKNSFVIIEWRVNFKPNDMVEKLFSSFLITIPSHGPVRSVS